jgi:starvation-inducible DNA-binding protein
MNMLAENLKVLLASTNVLAIKAQNFHWNVEGSDFPQYHKFLDEYYSDVYGSVDRIAEYIRALDAYTPGSLSRYGELSIIQDQTKIPRARLMIEELYVDNQKMIEIVKQVFSNANDVNEQGIANFMAERQDAFGKFGWQLRSILKTDRE